MGYKYTKNASAAVARP